MKGTTKKRKLVQLKRKIYLYEYFSRGRGANLIFFILFLLSFMIIDFNITKGEEIWKKYIIALFVYFIIEPVILFKRKTKYRIDIATLHFLILLLFSDFFIFGINVTRILISLGFSIVLTIIVSDIFEEIEERLEKDYKKELENLREELHYISLKELKVERNSKLEKQILKNLQTNFRYILDDNGKYHLEVDVNINQTFILNTNLKEIFEDINI